ncbi:MAG: 30S ribosomal protein S3ae [Candidatus Diapherotrites archaeon]|nr:30S ribosomal protein S3ae [Candidatus Diapherotrites archaeon]
MAGKGKKSSRTVDKWKKKQWYEIFAPQEFKRVSLGDTVATKPEQLEGRKLKVSMRKITNQIKKAFTEIRFKITEVKGNKAYTESTGHEVPESFLKKFIRRRSSKIQAVTDVSTKDRQKIRLKVMILTRKKATSDQRTAIHKIMLEEIRDYCSKRNSGEIISDLILGDLDLQITKKANKITPVKKTEIVKSKLFESK